MQDNKEDSKKKSSPSEFKFKNSDPIQSNQLEWKSAILAAIPEKEKEKKITPLTSEDIRKIILANDIKKLKAYVGDDPQEFIRIMKLESKEAPFIQMAGQNGKIELVNFFIENAMKSEEGKKLLAAHLLKQDESGRIPIHWIASVNKDEVAPCLTAILDAAKELGIFDKIINRKDTERGFTPLMLAADLGALENVKSLVKYEADVMEKSGDGRGRTAYDIALRKDPVLSLPILQYLVSEVKAYGLEFKRKFGDVEDILKDKKEGGRAEAVETAKTHLLNIEMDASLPRSAAQLLALKKVREYTLDAEKKEKPKEAELYLLASRCINFSQAGEGYQRETEKNKHFNTAFSAMIEIQKEYKLNAKEYEAFARGMFLSQFGYPDVQRMALALFASVKEAPPAITIKGFNAIKKGLLDSRNQFKLMQNLFVAQGKLLLNEIVQPDSATDFFQKNVKKSRAILQKVIDDISIAGKNEDIQSALSTIPPDDLLRNFKASALKDLEDYVSHSADHLHEHSSSSSSGSSFSSGSST